LCLAKILREILNLQCEMGSTQGVSEGRKRHIQELEKNEKCIES